MNRASAVLALLFAACSSHRPAPAAAGDATAPTVTEVPLPGGDRGIGFDDLQYEPALKRLLIPAGRTGTLDLIDPSSGAIDQVTGFTVEDRYGGGHGEGTTSASFGGGHLFATDRTAGVLDVIDPSSRTIVGHAALAAGPDYVRWIEPVHEVWVTEPDAEQIEVFTIAADGTPTSTRTFAVPGGPESLVVSPKRGRAYTHLWGGKTVAIDLASHQIVDTWANGCTGSRGIALDEARGWLFAACDEGKLSVFDVDHGNRALGSVGTGDGVDIIAYAPSRHRVYVPAGEAKTLSTVAVGDDGALRVVSTVPVASGAHCAVTDDAGDVWVCDPRGGRLTRIAGLP